VARLCSVHCSFGMLSVRDVSQVKDTNLKQNCIALSLSSSWSNLVERLEDCKAGYLKMVITSHVPPRCAQFSPSKANSGGRSRCRADVQQETLRTPPLPGHTPPEPKALLNDSPRNTLSG
jgi:hypothetical protein